MVLGGGFEPPKLSRQIYSLIPLATREPQQKSFLTANPFDLTTTSTRGWITPGSLPCALRVSAKALLKSAPGKFVEPPKLSRQSACGANNRAARSLWPLGNPSKQQKVGHFQSPTPPCQQHVITRRYKNGAGDRSRTYDLLITSQLLCQLSYTSSERPCTQATKASLHKRRRDSRGCRCPTQPLSRFFLQFLIAGCWPGY